MFGRQFLQTLHSPDDLETKPAEERRTIKAWMHRDAHSLAADRMQRAQRARRKKKPETRRWVIEKLRAGWSPQQIAGRSELDGRVSQERLDTIEGLLDDRPRRCLGYSTPREVHTKKLVSARKRALHL